MRKNGRRKLAIFSLENIMNLMPFYEFIYDRHLIWHKRNIQRLPAPWTDDTILGKYKFCNVYRELDRGSQYIIRKVLSKTELSSEVKLFNTYVFRIFNLDQLFDGLLFEDILDPKTFDFKKEEARLDAHKAAGKVMYNDAYTITQTVWNKEYGKKGKHIQVLLAMQWLSEHVSEVLDQIRSRATPEGVIETLREIPMVGPFLAGQIMLDLGYCGITRFTNNDWIIVGPGAEAGLEILFNRYEKIPGKELVALVEKLYSVQWHWFEELRLQKGKEWLKIALNNHTYPNLPRMDIQNSLCEFRKYHNINRSLKEDDFRCKHRIYKQNP
jgi:hypothetical protein